MFKLILALFLVLCVVNSFGAVIEADKDTLRSHLDGSSHVLLEFYAPWCGHCKNLAPEYKIVGDIFQPEDEVKIIAFDASEESEIADEFGVKGFPTLKWFSKGETTPIEYDGGRSASEIVHWINKKAGTKRIHKTPVSYTQVLDSNNFDQFVGGDKPAFVEFYAPWCGHCKSLAPKYEELSSIFSSDDDLIIAKVDASEQTALASKYGISGFPTLKFFPAGSTEPEDYTGGRETEDMLAFLNEKTGKKRTVTGGFEENVGRLSYLDELLQNTKTYTQETYQKAANLVGENHKPEDEQNEKTYLAILNKIVKEGVSYINKEEERINRLLSTNLKPQARSKFFLRLNILKAFKHGKDEL